MGNELGCLLADIKLNLGVMHQGQLSELAELAPQRLVLVTTDNDRYVRGAADVQYLLESLPSGDGVVAIVLPSTDPVFAA